MRFDITLWRDDDAAELSNLMRNSSNSRLQERARELTDSIRKQRTERKRRRILWAKMAKRRRAILKALKSSSAKIAKVPELPDMKKYKVAWLRICGYPKVLPKLNFADLEYFRKAGLVREVETAKQWSEFEGASADYQYVLYGLSPDGRDLVMEAENSGAE